MAGVRTPDGNIQLYDVDSGHKRGRPVPSNGDLLGFTPAGKLIVINSEEPIPDMAEIWDQDSGKQLAGIAWPTVASAWRLEGARLTLYGTDKIHSLDLDPKLWFNTLCKHNNRDFTDDERAVLAQLGAPDERPCG